MGQALDAFATEVTRTLTDAEFSQSQFNDLIKEVEEEYQKMRESAHTLCTSVQKADELLTPKGQIVINIAFAFVITTFSLESDSIFDYPSQTYNHFTRCA